MLVLELEGPLFFGTAEALARRVEIAQRDGVRFVVLDFKRVNEVDSRGARILLQLWVRLEREGKHLLLSHLPRHRAVATALHDTGVIAGGGRGPRVFHDIDRALEWAEDELIRAHAPDAAARGEQALATMDVAAGLDEAERAALAALLVRRVYDKGATVFHEGDHGRELFLIAAGAASATLRLDEGRQNRLATFSAGTVFGELALLDPGPRSATIVADETLVCYVLTEDAFERLRKDHPAVAITVLTNLGRELTRRLRRANRTIYHLEA
jgi:CRP-like cAMP-binding protein/anti-anti-sigma regulatory factor